MLNDLEITTFVMKGYCLIDREGIAGQDGPCIIPVNQTMPVETIDIVWELTENIRICFTDLAVEHTGQQLRIAHQCPE